MQETLIIGAGPTGLVLGLALLQRGIPVRILDKKEGPSIHSKAFGIHARSLEIFAKLGVVSIFLERGLQMHSLFFHRGEKESCFELKKEYLQDTPYPFVLMLPQSETEEILIEAFEKLGGKIEWKKELLSIDEKSALLATGEKIAFDWLLGCDGAKSKVRHLLQLPFEGEELPETFLIVDVKATAKNLENRAHFFFSKEGLVGIIALRPTLNRLIFPLRKQEKVPEETLEAIRKELKKRGCTDLFPEKLLWFSSFQIHRRMVKKLRVGNCLLVGDAAHIHSPAGGQGMNTGIQDAFNLAWKLSLIIQGKASVNLLESYEKERLPVAKKVLRGTTRFTQLLTFVQRSGLFSLFFAALWLMKTFFGRKMARGITELSLKYPKSLFIQESWRDLFWSGPKSGERAPNIRLESGENFFDYLNTVEPVLLLFQENKALHFEGVKTLVFKDSNLMKTYCANKESLYFIRPDGVIGYRSRRLKREELENYLQHTFPKLKRACL